MNMQVEAQRITAFVDGELDLASQLEMEERMRLDATLRGEVEELRQLREAIREGASYHAAPAALRRRLAGSGPPERVTPGRASVAVAAMQQWLSWRPMVGALGLAALLTVTASLWSTRSAQDDRLLDEVVASHVRSTLAQHLVDIASSEHHVVKPWLSSKLDFSPPVGELQIPGSVFLGGRVDYLNGHPVAALVYRQGEHVVNSFIWPSAAQDSRPEFAGARGFQTAHWSQAGMNHWVISDVNREEFNAVVAAIESTGKEH